MSFNSPASLNLPASTAVKLMVARQAAYPVWADVTNTYTWSYTVGYETVGSLSSSSTDSVVMAFEANINTWSTGNLAATRSFLGVAGSSGSPRYSIMGIDQNCGSVPFTYVPADATVNIIVVTRATSVPAGNTTAMLDYDAWNSPGQANTFKGITINISGGNTGAVYTTTFSENSWIRPRSLQVVASGAAGAAVAPAYLLFIQVSPPGVTATYTPSGSTAGTVALTGPPTGRTFMPLMEPAEFANSTLPWYSTRTTATSFLGTNVTQVLNKGGTVLAGRVSPQVENPFQANSSYISLLHPSEKAYLPLETGVYTYCPPSTDLASFWDYTVSTVIGIASCPVYRLDNDAMVNIMFLTASSVDESLACNVDWHVEFRTSSALFQIGLSGITLEAFHQAQLALASAGFFFENPEHKSVLGKVITAVRKIAPSAIGMLNPLAGRAAQLLLSDRPQNKMKTTTTDRSGYNGPPKVKASGKRPKSKPKVKKGKGKKK